MKIRNGFVTNSSSSSFVLINAKSSKLHEILSEIDKETLRDRCISIQSGNMIEVKYTDCYDMFEAEPKLDDFILLVARLISHEDIEGRIDSRGVVSELDSAALNIKQNMEDICKNISKIQVCYGCMGHGGDGERRFDTGSYTEDQLSNLYSIIASEHNKDIDEVTEEDFLDFVMDKRWVYNFTYSFDKKSGVVLFNTEGTLVDAYGYEVFEGKF